MKMLIYLLISFIPFKYVSTAWTNIFSHKHKLTVIVYVVRINYPHDVILNVMSLSDKDTVGQK